MTKNSDFSIEDPYLKPTKRPFTVNQMLFKLISTYFVLTQILVFFKEKKQKKNKNLIVYFKLLIWFSYLSSDRNAISASAKSKYAINSWNKILINMGNELWKRLARFAFEYYLMLFFFFLFFKINNHSLFWCNGTSVLFLLSFFENQQKTLRKKVI